MKKATWLGILFTVSFLVTTPVVHAATIARWTFESTVPSSAGPHSPEEGTGTATGVHADATTTYSNPNGNGSPESWNANRWAVGDYYQFQISTLGKSDIIFSWDQTRSSAGPGAANMTSPNFRLQYSTDGATFTNVVDYLVPIVTWDSAVTNGATQFSQNLSSITALNNQAAVYFRLTDILAPQNTGGQSRVDNILVTGVPEPGSLLLSLLAAAIVATHARRN